MPLHLLQPTLNGGEADPGLYHRVDMQKFSTWVKEATNFFVRPQGGLSNRPGTYMLGSTKTAGQKARLIPFSFSKTQSYVLEMGVGYIRFYTPDGLILDDNDNIYEVETDFTAEELDKIHYCQSADIMYFACEGHKPKQLARYGHANWVFSNYENKYGPFQTQNTDEKKKIWVTLNNNGIYHLSSDDNLFTPQDVGQWIKIKHRIKAVQHRGSSDSGWFLMSREVTLITSGTWTGTLTLEYTNDTQAGAHTLHEISGADNYNANDVISLPSGLWWVHLRVRVSSGSVSAMITCAEHEEDIFYKITSYVSPFEVTAEIQNTTKNINLADYVKIDSCIEQLSSNTATDGVFTASQEDAWKALDRDLSTYCEVPLNGTLSFSYSFAQIIQISSVRILGWGLDGEINTQDPDAISITARADSPTATDYDLTFESDTREDYVSWTDGSGVRTNSWRILKTNNGYSVKTITFSVSNAYANKSVVAFEVRGRVGGSSGDLSKGNIDWSRSAWGDVNGYPACVCRHGGRLFWAQHDEVQGTQIGDDHSFLTNSPLEDSDAIGTTLSDEGINAVQALVSMKSLLAFTAGGVFASNAAVMTPTDAGMPKQQASGGANVRPVVIGQRVIYALPHATKILDCTYDYSSDAFTGADLCLMAEHLFEHKKIKTMCYQQEPYGLLWVLQDDGTLLCLTYVPAENVCAWTKMQTQGAVESICSIPSGSRDELFLIVNRDGVRYVEKMAPRLLSKDRTEQFFVDCGRTYRGTETAVIGGLNYLEGKEVAVLADGKVQNKQKVQNGTITLNTPASVVHVGLPYTARMRTLSGDLNTESGSMMAKKKRYVAAMISMLQSAGAKVGCNENHLEDWILHQSNFDQSPDLTTQDKKFTFSANYEIMPSIIVAQDEPLPLTITAIMPIMQVGNL